MAPNLWMECYDGTAKRSLSEEEFRQTFCRVCRNPECELALGAQTKWQGRIATQEERLLNNPRFADPNDPRFKNIRAIDFPNLFRDAMALEIAAQRGDWEIPSQADALQLATLGRVAPAPEPPPEPEPDPPETETADSTSSDIEDLEPPEVIWEGYVTGDSGRKYKVTVTAGGEKPVWSCTCPSFAHKRDPSGDGLCKHIHWVQGRIGEDPRPPEDPRPSEVDAGPPPPELGSRSRSVEPQRPSPTPRNPHAAPGPRDAPFIPRLQNTPAPTGGLMVGGSSSSSPPATPPGQPAEAHDPWAVPTKPDNVVPVGGKIRLGLTGKKKDS